MTITIELPDNQHATFLTADELTNKQIKLLRPAGRKVGIVAQHLKDLGLDDVRSESAETDAPEDEAASAENNQKALAVLTQLTDDEDDDLDLFQRTCAAVRLVEWTLDLPLPKTPEDVDNLPRSIYTALTTEAIKLDLNEGFNKEDSLVVADPKELPTPDSNDSESNLQVVSP